MKRYVRALSTVALLLVMSLSVKPALAYFTTYTLARGVAQVKLGDTTEIEETYVNWNKAITITNTEGPDSCYVRAKVYFDSVIPTITINVSGTNWVQQGEYYYWVGGENLDGVLPANKNADILNVKINGVPENKEKGAAEYDAFSVVIVYESAPVEYDANGVAKKANDASISTWEEEFQDEKKSGN